MSELSIFSRIIDGEIPCHKVYEDEHSLAFMDIHPIQTGTSAGCTEETGRFYLES